MSIKTLHQYFLQSSGACTDTRKITKDCIFFALKGDHFDGNTYANEALAKGAKFCVIDDASLESQPGYIVVDEVLTTLQQLATYHRRYLNIPIIALTGSNGKTTTKELINAVLSTKLKTNATEGNLNNHIGVPLTLLTMTSETELGIVEMGANHLKEIALLSSIAEPDYGLITNFGKAHLEGFGGLEGVIKGKSELYDYLKANNGLIFYNADDVKQVQQVGNYSNAISYNARKIQDYQIDLTCTQPSIEFKINNKNVKAHLSGEYNFNNILVAIAIGSKFEVPIKKIIKGIESYVPKSNRSQWISKDGNTYFLDAYNANPSSMAVSLENFADLDSAKKIVVLGDMFELGADTSIEHQAIATLAQSYNFEKIYLVGEHFHKTETDSNNVSKFRSFEAFKTSFLNEDLKGYKLFIKGSRGMALERLLND